MYFVRVIIAYLNPRRIHHFCNLRFAKMLQTSYHCKYWFFYVPQFNVYYCCTAKGFCSWMWQYTFYRLPSTAGKDVCFLWKAVSFRALLWIDCLSRSDVNTTDWLTERRTMRALFLDILDIKWTYTALLRTFTLREFPSYLKHLIPSFKRPWSCQMLTRGRSIAPPLPPCTFIIRHEFLASTRRARNSTRGNSLATVGGISREPVVRRLILRKGALFLTLVQLINQIFITRTLSKLKGSE